MSCIMCHCVTNVIAVEHQVLNVWWAVLLRSDCSSVGLHFITQTRWTASLIFLSSPPPKPMYDMILPDSRLVPMYDTILPDSRLVPMCDTILSRFLYDINLGAMHTTILGIRGVTISIYLVSSATDSIRWSVVLFKPVSVPTSDPKSEFLCQSSLLLRRTYRPPWTPHTPGISHALVTTYHPYCHSPSALTEYLKQRLHHQRAKCLGRSPSAQVEQSVPLERNKCHCHCFSIGWDHLAEQWLK